MSTVPIRTMPIFHPSRWALAAGAKRFAAAVRAACQVAGQAYAEAQAMARAAHRRYPFVDY